MKRYLLSTLLLLTVSTIIHGQSFRVWYANNVTDVKDLNKIEDENSGLNWRAIPNGANVSMGGNIDEVNNLKQMLSESRMKNLDDKRKFWTMRDHGLLCFKVEDLDGTHHTYEVIVSNDKDSISQTVDDFFFVNAPAPHDTIPYNISVRRVDNNETTRFKYFVYEWGDDRLYLFMLDQKRQVTGETYTLEYATGYLDEDGDLQKTVKTLDLKEDKFQSFYVPDGSDLLDIFLKSGDKKLRLDKSKLHTGIDLNDRMSYMEISSTFNLDKHEGREMMNFNWLGTGLYEKYDTLYLSLYNEKGKQIKNATFHPERVDYDGNRIYDPAVKYDGYDSKTKQHKIVTMSNPTFVEILVDGYLPMLYKYKGAVDEEGVVDFEHCQDAITMQKGSVANGINISTQHFLNLNDEKAIIVRNGIDHRLCTIDAVDLSGRIEADTISYMDDCGNDFPKLLDNKVVERYAQFEASFSRPKGSGAAPASELFATNIETGTTTQALNPTLEVVSASTFTSFDYDYYFARFDLNDVIEKGTTAKIKLKVGNSEYSKFPYLRNLDFNRDEAEEDASEEVNEKYVGDNNTNSSRGFADAGFDMRVPVSFKFSFKPVTLSTALIYNIRKNLIQLKINVILNRGDAEGKVPGESEAMSRSRKELKDIEKYENFKVGQKGRLNITGDEPNSDDWIYDEIDDIFDISSKHIGTGWFGGAKLALKMPPFDFKRFQVTEALGTIGYGFGYRYDVANNERFEKLQKVLELLEDWLCLSASFEASTQVDFGIKSFQEGTQESMSSTNMGYSFQFSGKLSLGIALDLFSKEKVGKKDFKLAGLVNAQAGLRLGGKLGFRFGVEGPFDSYVPGIGASLIGVLIGQAYISVKSPIFSVNANAGFQLGGRVLIPDNDHNPFHNDFPYWLNENEAKPIHLAYRRIPAPETTELCGKAIINDVAMDANPEFIDVNNIVYNDMGSADDYNDDKVVVAKVNGNEVTAKETISIEGLTATNHRRSKRGDNEIIVYEQISQAINKDEITEDNVVSKNSEVQQHTRICASMRQGTGNWTRYDITTDDGYADLKPVATMQENGHAAVVYQHGKFDVVDPNVSADSLTNVQFKGNLMLRTYNGTEWSEPTALYDFDLDGDHLLQQYDLLMRGDTVLVAATLLETNKKPVTRFASKHISSNTISYYDEALEALSFHMKRVGQNAVMAMIYNGSDSISDIYVKTINMTGRGDGCQGNDLGVGFTQPACVKIITDSNAEDMNNFAVMWTQMSNVYRDDEGGKKFSKNSTMLLNASRIFISNSLQITDPITLGAEMVDTINGRQRNLVITNFDGFLDDAKITTVYTLADVTENGSVIMRNEKYFRNSCEWDVSYGSQALLGSGTLPVIISIKNTGTSAINAVTAVINGENYPIADAYVKPFNRQEFVVNYPIDDNFDGYISSQVIVEYLNTFKAQAHPRRAAMNFRRMVSSTKTDRVTLEDIECNVVSHRVEDGKNIFVVELIDHANLHEDMIAYVGVFPHPNDLEPLSMNAWQAFYTDNFTEIGGIRKAYATLEVEGITEPIQAYVNCHLLDTQAANTKSALAAVRNARALDTPTLVNLFPVEDPATIIRNAVVEQPEGHKAAITTLDKGVRIDGLTAGHTLRIFSSEGFCVFKKDTTSSTISVPLKHHNVYLLSTGEEIFKFRY